MARCTPNPDADKGCLRSAARGGGAAQALHSNKYDTRGCWRAVMCPNVRRCSPYPEPPVEAAVWLSLGHGPSPQLHVDVLDAELRDLNPLALAPLSSASERCWKPVSLALPEVLGVLASAGTRQCIAQTKGPKPRPRMEQEPAVQVQVVGLHSACVRVWHDVHRSKTY